MKLSPPLILGIDSSTTACKAIVFDLHGTPVVEGRATLPLSIPRPTWHEQPAEMWWQAVVRASREAMSKLEVAGLSARAIVALCIAPQRETFVPVDEAGRPLRSAIVWMDERARDLLPTIAREYGAARIHSETGKPLSGNLSLGKIAWLREHEPGVFARTAKYLDVAAFLTHKLTGHYRTGWGCVDPMGLFDMRTNRWNTDLLAYLDLRLEQMPEAFPPATVTGTLTADAAAACRLPAGIPVVAGVGDGQAGGIGVNITQPGQAYLNLGTAVVSGTYTETYITDPAFRTMGSAIPGTYSLETVLLGGTYTITWFMERMSESANRRMTNYELRMTDYVSRITDYENAITAIPPGAEGLMLVPYWNSVMNPYWDAAASGIVVGWRGNHTCAHLYQAILEGIAFEQRLHAEGVEAALGWPVESYLAMGGGARSAHWRQIIADVTGKPVTRAATPEAAALGAAIQAAAGVGLFPDVRTAAAAMSQNENEPPFIPDTERHEFYTQLYEQVYRHLFPTLQPYLDKLAHLTA
ncbi:MAG: xylulose kinase [Anaerolineae bacterium]|nr:xylulose kinase [Anaerolineae bacterium]